LRRLPNASVLVYNTSVLVELHPIRASFVIFVKKVKMASILKNELIFGTTCQTELSREIFDAIFSLIVIIGNFNLYFVVPNQNSFLFFSNQGFIPNDIQKHQLLQHL
jgi:hypothetical protein